MADSLGTWAWSNAEVYLGSQYESQMHLEPVFASPDLPANTNANASADTNASADPDPDHVADTLIDRDGESQGEFGIVEPLEDACRLPAIILNESQSQGIQELRFPGVPVSWQGDYSEMQKLEPDSMKDNELGNSCETMKQKPDCPEDDAQGNYNETQDQSQGVQESRSPGVQQSSRGDNAETQKRKPDCVEVVLGNNSETQKQNPDGPEDNRRGKDVETQEGSQSAQESRNPGAQDLRLCDGLCNGLCNKWLCNNMWSQKMQTQKRDHRLCDGLCNKWLCNNMGSQKVQPESVEAPGAKRPKSVSSQLAVAKLLAGSSYPSDLDK